MPRTSRARLDAVFARLLQAIGGRLATSWDDVGAYRLDYAACYGGWTVERICNKSGGVSHPFGPLRRKASDFDDAMQFAICAAEQAKQLREQQQEAVAVVRESAAVRMVSAARTILAEGEWDSGTIERVADALSPE